MFSRLLRPLRWGTAACVASLLLATSAYAQNAKLIVATATSPATRGLEIAAQEAKKHGLDVQIIEFTDWLAPNTAVANGEADVNHFQHRPFLEQSERAGGFDLEPIAQGYTTTIGLYSKKIQSLDELRDGAKVAIAHDPINTARSLLTLQEAGLIQLKDGGTPTSDVNDIMDNPKKLDIVQIDGPAIARSFDDLDAAVTYATFVKLAGLDVHSPIYREKDNSPYDFVWATLPARAQDANIHQFIEIYRTTPAVKQAVLDAFDGLVGFPWEPDFQRNAAVTR